MAVQQDFRVKKGLFVNESSNVVGNSAVGGNMTITGTIAVSNNTTMGGTLNVSRATTLSNTLAVVGTTTVTGATTLANTLNTTGAVSLANTLGVTGATTLSSTLLVQGASTVNNTLTVAGTLSTTGATTLSNTLSAAGATTLSSTLSTTGVATFANTLSATGATTLSNTLSTSGAATFLNTLLVQGATTVNNNLVVANTLTVTRAATLANTLGVTGAATFANTLSVTGALTVGGNLTVSGSLTYINTTALNIGDAVIALNAELGAVAPTENAGLEVNRGTSANSYIYWNETNDRWEATGNASLAAANSEIHIGGTGPSNYTVDNSNGSVLQDVALTFDSFGHVRTVATTTANLDTRYLSFSSVVSDGVTVAADLYNDTLTLANGAGIAVSADATTDTITFSHYDTSSAASIAIDNSGGTVLQDVAVTLDAYGHITAVSAASANLDTRYSQLSFSTLAVSGQSNVVADAIADTLKLAGNNGITITTDATTDTVTFTGPSKIPAWTTARTLTLGGDLTGNVTFDGSANFTLTAAVNDGSGSGLDADLLDGQDGAYYRNATNINAGTLDKARLPASVDTNTTGNAATATKTTATAPTGGSAELMRGAMGGNDFFLIRIGGNADAGWSEIATADNGTEPIYVRQYTGDFVSVVNEMKLLDESGNTVIPRTLKAITGGVTVKETDCGIYPGNGDSATQTINNMKLTSWFGIGFGPSISNQAVPLGEYSHWFNVRNGDMGIRGTFTASQLNGNASTATTLQTARTINSVSFNGSANITVEPYIETDSSSATRYLTFVDSITAGYQRMNMDSGLTYNPATNLLSATVTSDINEVGKVVAFARSSAPSGFLKCNGAAVSRTTYAALYAAIGTTFGSGDGSTTFNVPDLRGEFVRGWDDARGIDSGRTFGSWQDGQNVSHTHSGTTSSDAHTHTWSGTTSSAGAHTHTITVRQGDDLNWDATPEIPGTDNFTASNTTYNSTSSAGAHTHTVSGTTSSDSHTHTMTTAASGGTEVRVRNRALLYCIKY